MATASDPVQPVKAPKHEVFVEQQLEKATSRIRLLDIGAAVLILGIGTFLYGLTSVLLDRWLDLPPLARQIALGVYLVFVVAVVGRRIVWPLCQRINPYYAAVQVEHAVPGAKNSVVNWLDLKDEKLPWTIRAAVGQKAAKDLSEAPLEEAISGRRIIWLVGGLAILLFALLATMVAIGPGPFSGLIQRAFLPFGSGEIPTQTTLQILAPEPADASVALNQSVPFKVKVEGRVPDPKAADAIKLLFRYSQTDPTWTERKFERDGNDWSYRLPSFELHGGIWYRVTGGDYRSAEHRIDVRSSPLITGFEVKYQPRPYLKRPFYTTADPNLEGLRGTAVTLTVRTNRPVKKGWLALDVDGAKTKLEATPVPESREAMRFNLVLDKAGSYRLSYLADGDEASGDSLPYSIKVIQDHAPEVLLTEPGDTTLPINGVLQPLGTAFDDFGITAMTLRMRVRNGPGLAPHRYRAGKSFAFPDGAFPRNLAYSDVIELAKLTDEAGQPVSLKPNMEIEYWLEVADNCDYPEPGPNIGKSAPPFVITLTAAIDPKQQQEQINQARQNQQQHEREQDQQLQKQVPEPPGQPPKDPRQEGKTNPVSDKLDKQRNPRDAADATPEDVDQAAGDLKSNNPQRRQNGAQRLDDIAQRARDEKVRDQAVQALEDAGLRERRPEHATREDVNNANRDLQDPRKQNQARQRLNDIKDRARQPDVRAAAQDALNNQPNPPDNATKQDVDRAAQNLKDNSPAKRQQARQELRDIKDLAKDQAVRKAAEQQLQHGVQNANKDDVNQAGKDLKNGNPNQQENAARDLRDMKRGASDPGVQKAAENTLKQAGKDPNLDPKNATKEDVNQAIQKAQSNDPAQRQQGRHDLRDIANHAKDKGVQKAADQALDQANQNANQDDVNQGADQAQDANAKERKEGRQDLRQMQRQAKDKGVQQGAQKALQQANQNANQDDVNQAKQQAQQSGDPQERQEGRQELRQMQQHAKDPGAKQAAQQALQQANQNAGKEDVNQAAQQAKSGNPQDRQAGRQDLRQMAQQAKDKGAQQAAQQALNQANQDANQPDVGQEAQSAKSTDPGQKQEGKQSLRDIATQAKDPATREAARRALQQSAEQATKEDASQASQQAQSGDAKQQQDGKQNLRDIAKHAKDAQAKQGAEKALQQANEKATGKDVDQAGQQAGSGDPTQKQQAKDSLKDMQKLAQDPAVRKQAAEALKEFAKNATPSDVAKLAKEMQEQQKAGGKPDPQDLKDMADLAKDPNVQKLAQDLQKELAKQNDARQAGQPQLDQAAKDLKSGDPEREKAGTAKAQDIAQHAQDPKVQKQAEEMLKQAGKPTEKPGQKATPEDVQKAKEKLKSTDRDKFQEGLKELAQAAQNAQDAEAKAQANESLDQIGLSKGDREKCMELANNLTNEGQRDNTVAGMKANLEYQKFAGEMQLLQFKEVITPDMLKKANISEDEWQRFLKDYRDILKQMAADLKELEKFDPKERVVLLPGGGVRRIDATQAKPENLQNAGQSLPPPTYRNAYEDFTRDLSRMQRKLEKADK